MFRENKLCAPKTSIKDLLVIEAHKDDLIGHFSIAKRLDILREHFFFPTHEWRLKECKQCVRQVSRLMI